ncbi:MAG: hypothetical protein IJW19_07010 [Clostridia bacterium]|nr:hypothetical protein [Clostridia bacterium]
MYTRHLNIPKNYNGVRFSGRDDGIPVKEHRPVYTEGIKTSHSPLYKHNEEAASIPTGEENSNTLSDISTDYTVVEEDDGASYGANEKSSGVTDDGANEKSNGVTNDEEYEVTSEELSNGNSVAEVSSNEPLTESDVSRDKSFSSFPALPIKELLDGIDTEELLLIGVILLIASEKNKDNNSILTMLSLLLLWHK